MLVVYVQSFQEHAAERSLPFHTLSLEWKWDSSICTNHWLTSVIFWHIARIERRMWSIQRRKIKEFFSPLLSLSCGTCWLRIMIINWWNGVDTDGWWRSHVFSMPHTHTIYCPHVTACILPARRYQLIWRMLKCAPDQLRTVTFNIISRSTLVDTVPCDFVKFLYSSASRMDHGL